MDVTQATPFDRVNEAIAHRDPQALGACLDADVEWLPLSAVFGRDPAGSGVIRGREAVCDWLVSQQGNGYAVRPVEVEERDGRTLATFEVTPNGGAPATIYGLFTFRDGLLVEAHPYATEESARRAFASVQR